MCGCGLPVHGPTNDHHYRRPRFEIRGRWRAGRAGQDRRAEPLDGKGNIFFTDEAFSLVLKVHAGGRLAVVAGAPQVNRPRGIAVDAAGSVYVVDSEGIEFDPFHPFLTEFARSPETVRSRRLPVRAPTPAKGRSPRGRENRRPANRAGLSLDTFTPA